MGRESGGSTLGGMAAAVKGAAAQRIGGGLGLGAAAERGRDAAWSAMAGGRPSPASSSASTGGEGGAGGGDAAPAWARQLRSEQNNRHRRQLAVHALREGASGGGGITPDIKERD
jgi:type IV secretion system protein TrbL